MNELTKGYEVEWYDCRDPLPPEAYQWEGGDLDLDWIASERKVVEEFATKADAMRRAKQIHRGGWDFYGCVHVQKFEDVPDPKWPGLADREYEWAEPEVVC